MIMSLVMHIVWLKWRLRIVYKNKETGVWNAGMLVVTTVVTMPAPFRALVFEQKEPN